MAHFLKVLTLVLLSWSVPALAQTCGKVDLSHKIGGPKYRGKRAFCYAFAISQVMSSELGIKPPDTLSAFDMLSVYVTANRREINKAKSGLRVLHGSPGEGLGFVSDYSLANKTGLPMYDRPMGYGELLAAEIAQRGHVCLESQVPSQALFASGKDNRAWRYMEDRIGYSTGQYMEPMPTPMYTGPRVYGREPVCDDDLLKRQLEQGRKIHGAVNDWSAAQMTLDNAEACTKPIRTGKLDITLQAFNGLGSDPALGAKAINEQLDQGHVFDLGYDRCLTYLCDRKDNEPHEAVVMGREPDPKTGECLLVIQDVFGRNCRDVQSDTTCKEGVYKVPLKKIAKSRFSITGIRRAPGA